MSSSWSPPQDQPLRVAIEVSIDVVGMILVFREGPVDEQLLDADLPELPDQNLETIDQHRAPARIPVRVSVAWPLHQGRGPQFLEAGLPIACRQHAVLRERRDLRHSFHPPSATGCQNLTFYASMTMESRSSALRGFEGMRRTPLLWTRSRPGAYARPGDNLATRNQSPDSLSSGDLRRLGPGSIPAAAWVTDQETISASICRSALEGSGSVRASPVRRSPPAALRGGLEGFASSTARFSGSTELSR